ncbi:unnamed protein product [Pylaiella littoralis]
MSMIGRFVSQKSPSRQREAKNKEGVLTAEQQDEIVQIFKLCDVNGDGSVTKPELKEVLWSLGQHPSEEEMNDIYAEYDVHSTGALDFISFKLLMTTRLTYENTREEFEDAFRAIDRNKDGQVDITELNRLMVATGFVVAATELRDIFSVFDQDGSGKIDLEEFLDYMMGA